MLVILCLDLQMLGFIFTACVKSIYHMGEQILVCDMLVAFAACEAQLPYRACSSRCRHGFRTGKGTMVGFAAIDLRPAALFCASTRSPFRAQCVLRQGFTAAAPEVGSIEVEIMVSLFLVILILFVTHAVT